MRLASLADLERLAELATPASLRQGEFIRRPGDACTTVAVVVDGCAILVRDGRLVGNVGPGELIAGQAPLDVLTRDADVIASTPMRLLLLDRDDVYAALNDTGVTAAFVHSALARLRQSEPAG